MDQLMTDPARSLRRLVALAALAAWSCQGVGADDDDGGTSPMEIAEERCREAGEMMFEAPTPESWPSECDALEALAPGAGDEPVALQLDLGTFRTDGPAQVNVTFENRLLTSFEGAPCTWCDYAQPQYIPGDPVIGGCNQRYRCGDCSVSLSLNTTTGLRALSVDDFFSSAVECPYDASYTFGPCAPRCEGRECGPDWCGGECGSCGAEQICDSSGRCVDDSGGGGGGGGGGSTACAECLASCTGLPSCCQGRGCLCESECMLTGCVEGLYFCCYAYGCLCRTCPCSEWPCD